MVWNRDRSKAERLASRSRRQPSAAGSGTGGAPGRHNQLRAASSRQRWSGALAGTRRSPRSRRSYTPEMRECDDDAVLKARVFVDSRCSPSISRATWRSHPSRRIQPRQDRGRPVRSLRRRPARDRRRDGTLPPVQERRRRSPRLVHGAIHLERTDRFMSEAFRISFGP